MSFKFRLCLDPHQNFRKWARNFQKICSTIVYYEARFWPLLKPWKRKAQHYSVTVALPEHLMSLQFVKMTSARFGSLLIISLRSSSCSRSNWPRVILLEPGLLKTRSFLLRTKTWGRPVPVTWLWKLMFRPERGILLSQASLLTNTFLKFFPKFLSL